MDKTFLDITEQLGKFSKCQSFKMAAVIVKNGRIISTGINGTPPGTKNCNEVFPEFDPMKDIEIRKKHHKWSEKFEIHAEMNAILNATVNGINISDSTIYISNLCCFNCLKHILGSGIKRIVYKNYYDHGAIGKDVEASLKDAGVSLELFSNT